MFYKSQIPQVMFLAVCARPRQEYAFDGKIGLWSFTLELPAKWRDVRTGTEDVSVTAAEFYIKIVGMDGVFDSKSMWRFHKAARYKVVDGVDGVRMPCGKHVLGKWEFSKRKGTKCREAGMPLFYQPQCCCAEA